MYGFNQQVCHQTIDSKTLRKQYILSTFLTSLGIYTYFVIDTVLIYMYMFNVTPVVLRVYKTYSSTMFYRPVYER